MQDTGCLGLVHWDDPPRGMVWGGRWEGASGLGTCVHPWRIHLDVWQKQYNIVITLQLNKFKLKKRRSGVYIYVCVDIHTQWNTTQP